MPARRDPAEPKLVPVSHVARAAEVLWELLKERPPEANISHKEMPTWDEHVSFVERYPYRVWYLIRHGDDFVGSVYMTRHCEVGIFIFVEHQGKGYGKWAMREMLRKWGPKVIGKPSVQRKAILANVSPANVRSQKFFGGLGGKLVMYVYAFDIEE